MTNRELQIFMAVVDYGKMSEAAKKLYITQSSVSQAIASIEKEYDILLFERLSNSLFLTPEGEKLASYARTLFSVKDDMDDYLSNTSHHHKLRVGATVTVGTCVISPVLKNIKERLPGIVFSVNVANTHIIEDKLINNEIDVGLVEGNINDPDLVVENVIDDSLVLVCPPGHRFSDRTAVSLDELENECFILREKGSGTRALFEEQMKQMHIDINVGWSCYNSEAIKNAVMDGHGVSIISKRLVEQEMTEGRLKVCDINNLNLERHFALVYHKNKFISEEMNLFIDECRRFGKIPSAY